MSKLFLSLCFGLCLCSAQAVDTDFKLVGLMNAFGIKQVTLSSETDGQFTLEMGQAPVNSVRLLAIANKSVAVIECQGKTNVLTLKSGSLTGTISENEDSLIPAERLDNDIATGKFYPNGEPVILPSIKKMVEMGLLTTNYVAEHIKEMK